MVRPDHLCRTYLVRPDRLCTRTKYFVTVPQGSVLGPLLFLLYVNDIPLSVDSPILLFADDAKIFRSIRCEADYLQLQRDIDILFKWSRTWLLNFNISKCYVLHLGLTHSYGNYCIDGNVITSTESVKDLGIIVDSSLKFHNHTAIVTARANRILFAASYPTPLFRNSLRLKNVIYTSYQSSYL